MAVTVYVAQNLLKNQQPVVYYGGLIGAGLLAWQITEWLDRRYRLSRPDLFGSEDDDYDWSEGDYSVWDYGEPACHICQEHTDEPNAADKSCEVCDMLLCEWCYNDESHTCLKNYNNFGEINCEDCGGAIKVLYQVGDDGPEQGWCDCQSQSINKKCTWCGKKGVCCTDEDSKNSVSNITNKYGEKVVDAWPMGNPDETEYVCRNCCFIHGDRSILIPNLIESTED